MRTISLSDYERRVQNATVISRDRHGDKVLLLPGGEMVKLFRRKRKWSSAAWNPYATRFAHAARELEKREIPTVAIIEVLRIKDKARDAVFYQPLAGQTLRGWMSGDTRSNERLADFAAFLALLHEQGIYFRSIHLANVVVTACGKFGLIDLAGMSFYPWSLGIRKRVRNFKLLVRHAEDESVLKQFGLQRFLNHYFTVAMWDKRKRNRFCHALKHIHPSFDRAVAIVHD